MIGPLRVGVGVCAAWTILAWVAQSRGAQAYGRRTWWSVPAGSAWRGIAYAFGPGMSPTAKESVRDHLPAYFAGVAYHAGIFAALVLLAVAVRGVALEGFFLGAARAATLLGALGGAALLVRRLSAPSLRAISVPDDYVANLLTTLVVGLGLVRTLTPSAEAAFLGGGMLLLLYAPAGKIRHCLFFFPTRAASGALFGRRGVFPPVA